MPEPVHLQFTQDDRDLLMRMEQKLDTSLQKQNSHGRRLASHHRRLRTLESLRDEGRGLVRGLKWLWGAIAAIAGAFGWHIAKH